MVVKWHQPLLRDGSPIPVAAYGYRNEARIEFKISCRSLLDGKAEDVKCFCVVYCTDGVPGAISNAGNAKSLDAGHENEEDPDELNLAGVSLVGCTEIGRTEVVYNSSNPDFATTFSVKYSTHFDKLHDIIVFVFSEQDVMSDDLKKQRYLGRATVRLERVFRAVNLRESHPLESGGNVSISVRVSDVDCEFMMFCYSGKDFKKRSKNPVIKAKKKIPKNPYLVVSYRNKKYSKWRVLWKSEAVRGSGMANFGFGQFQVTRVNKNDEDTPIQILAMDWDEKNQSYRTIGQVEIPLREMTQMNELDISLKGKCTGHLVPDFVERVNVPSLANYLVNGGCLLDITFAVDFSSNNGGPGNPESNESLHFLYEDGRLNMYQRVLKNISDIFREYSDESKFRLWCYGAISNGTINHHFTARKGGGCGDVMSAYAETVRSDITMSGPKLIRPTIDAAMESAMQKSQSKRSYSILIVTCCDGTIGDTSEAIEKISQASYAPLSIVFVGIGDGDFKDLKEINLECSSLVSPSGNGFLRDVASFVHMKGLNVENENDCMHKIVEKIPMQIVQYNLTQGIFPSDTSNTRGSEVFAEEKRESPAEELSLETEVTDERKAKDYGKHLLDSLVAFDSDEDEPDLFEQYRVEGSNSEDFDKGPVTDF